MDDRPLLTATDFSEHARPALRTASRMAKRRDVPLTVLHCMEWAADLPAWHGAALDDEEEYRAEGRRQLVSEYEEAVSGSDQPAQVHFEIAVAFPEEAIVEVLDDGDFALAVIGATGLNRVANFFLGSVPEDVVRRSSTPVLVVPGEGEPETPFESIVAPVDFTPCSRRSLDRAGALARETGAKLTVVHATPVMADIQAVPTPSSTDPGDVEALEEHQAERFHEFLDGADLDGIDWESRQLVGTPHDVISETVEDVGADLVVMGTHGRRGFERLFLGSTATKVLRSMPCSVMTVRYREDETDE